MISLKKSYARQLLQLALTLSLLRVDPEHYLGWGWESQLALQNGDGWQLELRGAPLTDHSYSNRKALIPLIEDLVRFDRQHDISSSHNVQTYLLNVQNEQVTAMASAAPSVPPSTTTASAAAVAAALAGQPESNATTVTPAIGQTQNATRDMTEFTVPIGSDLADYFLNADAFAEATSVFDQNLADLNDYEGVQNAAEDPFANFNSLYAGLPLKDEPSEMLGANNRLVNLRISEPEQTASTSSGDFGSNPFNHSEYFDLLRGPDSPRLNYTKVIEWATYFKNETDEEEHAQQTEPRQADGATIKTETEEEAGTSSGASRHDSGMKLEPDSDEDSDGRSLHSDGKNSTSGFSSNVELTEEVSAFWCDDGVHERRAQERSH